MTLKLKHFDTHTGKWLKDPTKNEVFAEKLTGTWLEAKFPGVEFSIAHMDEATTEEELVKNHPENHRLFLATPSGLLIYAPEKDLPKIEEAFPDKTHRIAYSSIFKGECINIFEQSVSSENQEQLRFAKSILIIDDATGDNGDYLPKDKALSLIGDGHGKSSALIAKLTESEDCMIQFRLGLPTVNMQAKGTFAPIEFEQLPWNGEEKPDLIVPISCFKGNKPTPGLYKGDLWLGEKNRSEPGKIAMSSLIPFYTEGLQDVLPTLDANAQKLAEVQNNLTELAEFYCVRYEKRKEQTITRWEKDEVNANYEDDSEEKEFTDSGIYLAIRAAIFSGDPSMLEMAPIVKELQEFAARSWKQIAIAKDPDLNWERVMIMPSNKLQQGIVLEDVVIGEQKFDRVVASEICDYSHPPGEILLSYRAPLFDKDNVSVFINKYLPDCLGLNGDPLKGVSAISSLSWENVHEGAENRINAAISQQPELALIKEQSFKEIFSGLNVEELPASEINSHKIKEIALQKNQDQRTTERDYLNHCLWALKEKGIDLKIIVPVQTVCELQASDFDGDCIGVAKASKFPHIFAETVKQSQSDKCREPIDKFKKEVFNPNMSVEQIAIHMYDPPVGLINYSGTTLKSLRSELELIEKYGSKEEKASYSLQVIEGALQKLKASEKAISKGENDPLDPDTKKLLTKLTAVEGQDLKDLEKSDQVVALYSSLLRAGIAVVDQENQVAVDGMKSARKPDMELVDGKRKSGHRPVTVTSQKKRYGIYALHPIDPKEGCSPLELTAANTNVYWEKAQLQPRPLEQFKDLFPAIYTPEQKGAAQKAKAEYDQVFVAASKQALKERNEKGATLVISDSKVEILIANLKEYQLDFKELQIKLEATKDKKSYHKLTAVYAQCGSDSWQPLGDVCEIAREKLNLQAGQVIKPIKASLHNPSKKSDLLFDRAREIATEFYESIPVEEKKAVAAAVGHLCTTREDGKPENASLKNSRFMFATFPEEIADYIRNPAITNLLTIVRPDAEITSIPKNQNVFFQVGVLPNSQNRTLDVFCSDGTFKPFAALLKDSAQLVPGTKVKGQIVGSLNSTLKLQVNLPDKSTSYLSFGKVNEYDLASSDMELNGLQVKVILSEKKVKQPSYVLSQDGIVVGTLTKESVEKLQEKNCLNEGKIFELKALTTGKDYSAQVQLTSDLGNQLKLTKINPTAPRFKGEKAKFTLSSRTKEVAVTLVNLEIDGQNYCAGEFTNSPNSKASIDILKKAGLFGNGSTFEAKVYSPDSIARVKIDRNTLDFPEVPPPIKLKENINEELHNEKLEDVSNHSSTYTPTPQQQKLLIELKSNPTIFSVVSETEKENKTYILAVDRLKAEQVIDSLVHHGFKPIVANSFNPAISSETSKGYVVISLPKEDIPQSLQEKLIKRLGEPIDRTVNDKEYKDRLAQIPFIPGRNRTEVDLHGLKEFLDGDNSTDLASFLGAVPSKEFDLMTSLYIKNLEIPEEIKNLSLSVKQHYGGKSEIELYKNVLDDTAEKLLTFTFKTESGRNRAVEELGLPIFFDRYKSYCAAVPLEEAKKFMAHIGEYEYEESIDERQITEAQPSTVEVQETILPQAPIETEELKEPRSTVEAKELIQPPPSIETEATQIIVFSLKENGRTKSNNEIKKWQPEKINTGKYSAGEVVLIVGDNPGKGIKLPDLKALFIKEYQPLIDKGIENGAHFELYAFRGIEKMAQEYLEEKGFILETSPNGLTKAINGLLVTPSNSEIETNLETNAVKLTSDQIDFENSSPPYVLPVAPPPTETQQLNEEPPAPPDPPPPEIEAVETSTKQIPKLIKKFKQTIGGLGQIILGNENEVRATPQSKENENSGNKTNELQKFLASKIAHTNGLLESNLNSSFDQFSKEIKFFVESVSKEFNSKATVERDDKGETFLVFTFDDEKDRNRAIEELNLVGDTTKPICVVSKPQLEEIEQFIKDELVTFQAKQAEKATLIKPLGDDFGLDDIVDEKDKKTMETLRDYRQQQRTEEVSPIVALELRSNKTTHKEGDRFILDYDSSLRLLLVTDKETDLPVMIAKAIGRDKNNDVVWESQPLPAESPGLTAETVKAFKELKQLLETEKAEAEEYFNNRKNMQR